MPGTMLGILCALSHLKIKMSMNVGPVPPSYPAVGSQSSPWLADLITAHLANPPSHFNLQISARLGAFHFAFH